MHGAMAALGDELRAVQVQMQQLATLREEEEDVPERMDRLEGILDVDRAAGHVREAVARATLVDGPVPHAVIADVLPRDVLDAAIEAIPAPILFEQNGRDVRELEVPPRLASTSSIATWSFVADLVHEVLGPALVEHFRGPLDRHVATLCPSLGTSDLARVVLAAGAGRIVLRQRGNVTWPRTHPWQFLMTRVCLASRDGASLPANAAVTVLDPAGEPGQASMSRVLAGAGAPCAFEFPVGPDRATRRLLLPRMDKATRRTWKAFDRAARE